MSLLKIWFREILRWFYWFPFRWCIQCLPLQVNYRIGRCAAFFQYYADGRKRAGLENGVQDTLGRDLQPRQIKRIVRRTFDHNACNAMENLLCHDIDKRTTDKLIRYEGLENLDKALDLGRGVILLHGHFGNEELIMPALGFRGYKMNQLASRWAPDDAGSGVLKIPGLIQERIFQLKIRMRERYPIQFIYIDRPLREVFGCLKRGEILTIAMDGREGSQWMEMDFLGKRGLFSPGPMKIALKTGSPVVPAFIVRRKGWRHTLTFHRPFTLEETGDARQDIKHNTQRFLNLLEKYIREYPCHYMKMFWVDAPFFTDNVVGEN